LTRDWKQEQGTRGGIGKEQDTPTTRSWVGCYNGTRRQHESTVQHSTAPMIVHRGVIIHLPDPHRRPRLSWAEQHVTWTSAMYRQVPHPPAHRTEGTVDRLRCPVPVHPNPQTPQGPDSLSTVLSYPLLDPSTSNCQVQSSTSDLVPTATAQCPRGHSKCCSVRCV
jgi:hypothetical protein